MRGIGVAVMCSTCGTSPAGAFASSVARWRTPKRCCSSTTTTANRSNTTSGSSSACVPTTNDSSPVASLLSVSARRFAVVEPVRSAVRTASPGRSAWSVAKCCSASTSVGAMKTACASCSTARRIACSATTVLPEPTSPMSRRCIGRGAASSPSSTAIAARWSPVSVNGSSSSRQRTVSDGGWSSTCAVPAARRCARRRRSESCASRSSSKASRRRPPSRSPACAATIAAARSGRPARCRARAGSGSTASCAASRCARTSARICVEDKPIVAG